MAPDPSPAPRRRADAERNREAILRAAREAFAEVGSQASMAEISRRAGVGMATLYRNFPSRQALLEVLYTAEVDAICAAAETEAQGAATPGAALEAWLRRFAAFFAAKHEIGAELLRENDRDLALFDSSRARIMAAGGALLDAAQAAGQIRDDLSLHQVLDLVIAVGGIGGEPAHVEPIVEAALAGLRPQR